MLAKYRIIVRAFKFSQVVICLALVANCAENPIDDKQDPHIVGGPQEHIPWPSLADTPWPMYRHDPQGTGRSQYVGPLSDPSMVIEGVPAGDGTIWGSAAIGNDNIIYIVTSGTAPEVALHAIAESGERLWRTTIALLSRGTPHGTTPTVGSNGLIYVPASEVPGIGEGMGAVIAVNLSGEIVWKYSVDEWIDDNVALDKKGNLYFYTYDTGKIISLTAGGNLRWELSLHPESTLYAQTILFSPDGSTFYVTVINSFYAITTDGEVLWEYITASRNLHIDKIIDSAGNIYFYERNKQLYISLNSDGEENWRIPLQLDAAWGFLNRPSPTIDINGIIHIPDFDTLWSINASDGSLKSIPVAAARIVVSDAAANIFFGGGEIMSALDPESNPLWTINWGDWPHAGRPASMDGTGRLIMPTAGADIDNLITIK